VGESGCGKTTVGLAVLGLTPTNATVEGAIDFNGRNVLAMKRRERSALRGNTIAFVSQEPATALDPLFTIGSQVSEAIRTHLGISRRAASRRAIELLTAVKIDDPERVVLLYPHQISGGMAQRVSIAIALAGKPDLLIADEPTTALDVTVQAEIIALLRSLQDETGMAILLISHDWGVIGEICSRTVVMYAGQVVERAEPEQIFSRPMHPYSAGMLAADPHFAKAGERLATIPGTVPAPNEWPVGCHFAARCPLATPECTAAPIPLFTDDEARSSRCIHIDLVRVTEYADG
jgi:peptide/nickel transport system permease protein